MEKFKSLGLSEAFLAEIVKAKFTEPSEIQEKTIPLVLAGNDVIGGSATGSGKTLAFGAGIIEKVEKGQGLQSLILTPTRELAEQITTVLRTFSAYKGLDIASVYGGVGINPQIRALEYADIAIATPGRVLDHLERGTINLSRVKILVLDEADRMLDMGFIDDVEKIIKHCPKERQTLLFSATISQEISRMAQHYMKNPIEISVTHFVDPSKLKQVYYDTPKEIKFSLLVHLLTQERTGLVMVFCNTRDNADFVARHLGREGIDAMSIHGGLSQEKRNHIMELFHENKNAHVLVCTDVAARGLDIKGISHVYNYDIPKTSEEYIHRIGRTARAGKDGIAVSIVASRDYENFRRVLEGDGIKIESLPVPEVRRIFLKIEPRGNFGGNRSFGGRSGGRSFRGGSSRGGSSHGRAGGSRGFSRSTSRR